MNRKKIEALRIVSGEKVLNILDALQIDYNENYQYVTSSCPVHNGEREDAWSWHLDREMWRCFSRGCEENFSKDIFGLVMGTLDCNFPAACSFIEKVVAANGIDIEKLAELHSNKQFIKKVKKEKEITIYPEQTLDKLAYHGYLEGRGYPRQLIEDYQIGITSDKYKQMSNRIIIPIRNMDGQLVGFTGRTLYPNWKDRKIPKWVHSKGFNGAENLFNIDKAAKTIGSSGKAILVEGPLDVLRLEHAGIHNGVAIFGRKLHNGQIALLAKCGAESLIIALDADNAGITGAESAFNTAKAFFNIRIISLDTGDVGDLEADKVREIFV